MDTEFLLTGQNVLESKLDVAGIKGRSLDERQVVLAFVTRLAA